MGKTRVNADALSRRPCAEKFCSYCNKVEVREEMCKKKFVGRIIFEEVGSESWKTAQLEDPSIAVIYREKEIGTSSTSRALQEILQQENIGCIGILL